MERADLEGFIEQEQDRGLRISTVRARLACIIAFLHFLVEQGVISGVVLKRCMKLKLPEVLPRAMNPSDVKKLLSAIDDIRDRAVILLLLGTGMRIGRPLGLRLNDLRYFPCPISEISTFYPSPPTNSHWIQLAFRLYHFRSEIANSFNLVFYSNSDIVKKARRGSHENIEPGKNRGLPSGSH